jgi:hypothetical protein
MLYIVRIEYRYKQLYSGLARVLEENKCNASGIWCQRKLDLKWNVGTF